MANTIISPSDLSDYNSRRVRVEVTGGSYQGMMHRGKYTITIPYSCLSQTIQSIHRLGGKITNISLPFSHSPAPSLESIQPLSEITQTHALTSSPQEVVSISSHNETEELQHSSPSPTATPIQQEQEFIAVLNSAEYTFTEEW
ncbi:phycobilisome linker polypeptide [Calothrix sp. 336/3]|uniref:phycobilisome linker polypeptide n=1 Tax=Calothrix sp. 336/3 TaxID=1337936 RepID=UPI00069AF089|nr:phycobilisome linker polypeptide [Calothrix sp. 336/3]